jgi:hypothetical protein
VTLLRKRCIGSGRKEKRGNLLAVAIISVVLFACISAVGTHALTTVTAHSPTNRNMSSDSRSDPSAYLYGFHLYNTTNIDIPATGGDLNLTFPSGWNVTNLGLNFFNGSLTKEVILNSTPITTSVMVSAAGGFSGSVSLNSLISPKIPVNSTVYQVQFNVTALMIGEPENFSFVYNVANSTYPPVDGNTGIAQRFFIANDAQNLTIQLSMFELPGTTRNLTVEVRRSTTDNHMGGLIKSISVPSTSIPLARNTVTINIPLVNLTAGYYFIALHTQGWLNSGGGYVVDTTLSKKPSSPSPGWMTFDRGVDWQNQTDIAGTIYYFGGFRLAVTTIPKPVPSEINLRINGFPVANTLNWNQTVWNNVSPYTFNVTSNYQVPLLNLTYKAWVYYYGANRAFTKGYHIMINGDPDENTTATNSTRNFAMMYEELGPSDLSRSGVVNFTSSTISLNLKLFNSSSMEIAGMLNVTAVAQLQMIPVSQTYSGPSSLELQFILNNTHPGGPYDNVSLAENALVIGSITSQIDNVMINNQTISRSLWSYNLGNRFLSISRGAFNLTSIPQFTFQYGSSINCTVTVFNNCTASASAVIEEPRSYPTPTASMQIQNTSQILDIYGPFKVYITVTNTSGYVINDTLLNLTDGSYIFNRTVTGEGIYGITITSVDQTGYNATRWVGAATVSDYVLSSPAISLSPSGNITSQQNLTISANVSYIGEPEFTFKGTINFTLRVGETGTIVQLTADKNNATGLYQAVYTVPTVHSATLLTIGAEACDIKNRISANSTSIYILPASNRPPQNPPPSMLGTIELGIVAVILLVPILAYLIAKYRKR